MSSDNQSAASLIAAYRRMHAAMLYGDTDSLNSLLAPHFTLVHMTGYVQPRVEWLQHIQVGRMRYLASSEDSVAAEVSDGKAVLRGRNVVRAEIWGAHGTWPLQMDIDFELCDGVWLMTHAAASTY